MLVPGTVIPLATENNQSLQQSYVPGSLLLAARLSWRMAIASATGMQLHFNGVSRGIKSAAKELAFLSLINEMIGRMRRAVQGVLTAYVYSLLLSINPCVLEHMALGVM